MCPSFEAYPQVSSCDPPSLGSEGVHLTWLLGTLPPLVSPPPVLSAVSTTEDSHSRLSTPALAEASASRFDSRGVHSTSAMSLRCLRNAESSIKRADGGHLVLVNLLSPEPFALLSVNVGTSVTEVTLFPGSLP